MNLKILLFLGAFALLLCAACGRLDFEPLPSSPGLSTDAGSDGTGAIASDARSGTGEDAGGDAAEPPRSDSGYPTETTDGGTDPGTEFECTAANQAQVCGASPCVDGYCCDQPCDGQCEACNLEGLEGTCTTVPDGSDDPMLGTACDGSDVDLCEDDVYESCTGGVLVCSTGTDTPEVCDSGATDENCDGLTDEPNALGCTIYYKDSDGDGHGVQADFVCRCAPDTANDYNSATGDDCNDDCDVCWTDRPETCDSIDNDCDGATDEGMDHPDWLNSDWRYRKKLLFDNSLQDESLSQFTVLVKLTTSNFEYGNAQPDGLDLRFTDDNGTTELTYHIESFSSGGDSYLWVKVTDIPANSSDDFIWMYYGYINQNAPDVQNASGTYDDYYVTVHHLQETSGTHYDSKNDNDGIPQNGVIQNADGKIAGADDFPGLDESVDLGSGATIDNVFDGGGTVSAWIFPRDWGESDYGRILDKSSSTTATRGWSVQLDNGVHDTYVRTLRFEAGFGGSQGNWSADTDAISLDAWQHVTVVYDNSSDANNPSLYINGQLQTLIEVDPPSGVRRSDADFPLWIGNLPNSANRAFEGVIDEIQISNTARSDDWIRAQYLSTDDRYITFLDEEEFCLP